MKCDLIKTKEAKFRHISDVVISIGFANDDIDQYSKFTRIITL